MRETIYDFQVETLDGTPVSMDEHRGKVLLIVNTASKCGLTPQFEGLEALYRRYQDRGLVVLGFPCNQFAAQDPESNARIGAFCQKNYGVSFPMHAKIAVNGSSAHPLYNYLRTAQTGFLGSTSIKWNFTKFLVDRDGAVTGRYSPQTLPEALASDIEALLVSS